MAQETLKELRQEYAQREADSGHQTVIIGGIEELAYRRALNRFLKTTKETVSIADNEALYCDWVAFLVEKTR